jgi:hypothetical protein
MSYWKIATDAYAAVPDKTVKVPVKLAVVAVGVVLVVAFVLTAAFKVQRQFGEAPVTLADLSALDAKVSACVPAPRVAKVYKSKKR